MLSPKTDYYKSYKISLRGWLTYTYNGMIKSSKKRGHHLPLFTKAELWFWIIDTGKLSYFMRLHNIWVSSGCNKWLKPSIDRKDNSKGYVLSNLDLTTWRKNCLNGAVAKRKIVHQLTPRSKRLLRKHKSLRLAAEYVNRDQACIRQAINYNQTSAGFRWAYA